MRPDDRVRIRHMIEAAEAAQRFIANRQRADLDTDEMLLFALVRAAEIIGEAASKVSDETRRTMPSVPWQQIVSMRNMPRLSRASPRPAQKYSATTKRRGPPCETETGVRPRSGVVG